nr:hypothetical protein [Tanacetum cinerariifolium]
MLGIEKADTFAMTANLTGSVREINISIDTATDTENACVVFKLKCKDMPDTTHIKEDRPAMAASLKGCPAKIR